MIELVPKRRLHLRLPKHTNKVLQIFKKKVWKKNLRPNSTDLNFIENLWTIPKTNGGKRHQQNLKILKCGSGKVLPNTQAPCEKTFQTHQN